MWSRIKEWLHSIGRPQFDTPLDEPRKADDLQTQREVKRELDKLSRELAAIYANMQHTGERFDDR